MKTAQFKVIIFLTLFLCISVSAQRFDKKYNEKFNANSDVSIHVDTRYTDIQIETWNKNTVSIEAIIEIEGASKEKADEIIKNWKFKTLGNKNEIEIISKTNVLLMELSNAERHPVFDRQFNNNFDFEFDFPEISVENLSILDSLHVGMPDALHFSEPHIMDHDAFHFEFDAPEFDYEKYKNDENYLKEWQGKMKKSLEKMHIEMKMNSVKMKKNTAKLKEELKAAQEKRRKLFEEGVEQRKEAMKLRQKHLKERVEEQKAAHIIRQQNYNEHTNAKKRIKIKSILEDRSKIKIKRIIKIKAPKDAKFNMNVKYGSMSFPN